MKVFKEEQGFTQGWLHLLLAVSFIVPLVLITNEVIEKGWSNTDARVGFIVVIISVLLTYGFIFSLKLRTRIDETGINFRFLPFHLSNKHIAWSELKSSYVRNYQAISEYGGWGMKGGKLWNKSKGVSYTTKGDVGIQLELQSGKKILLGTQRVEEAKQVLKTYQHKFMSDEN